VKVRRRTRPEGVEPPRVTRLRVLDAEHKRRRSCVVRRDAEGYEHDYHEVADEAVRLFTWDSEQRRSVSPVSCVHCGRHGFYVILELDDRWDDPKVEA